MAGAPPHFLLAEGQRPVSQTEHRLAVDQPEPLAIGQRMRQGPGDRRLAVGGKHTGESCPSAPAEYLVAAIGRRDAVVVRQQGSALMRMQPADAAGVPEAAL